MTHGRDRESRLSFTSVDSERRLMKSVSRVRANDTQDTYNKNAMKSAYTNDIQRSITPLQGYIIHVQCIILTENEKSIISGNRVDGFGTE